MYADGTSARGAGRVARAGGALVLLLAAALTAAGPARADAPQVPAPSVPPASAAPAAAPPAPARSADELLTEARRLFHEEHYPEAAATLEAAFRAEPKPLFLFNAGQAYRKGDRPREALKQYQRFLSLAPDDPLAAEARGYIRDMHFILKKNLTITGASDGSARTRSSRLGRA